MGATNAEAGWTEFTGGEEAAQAVPSEVEVKSKTAAAVLKERSKHSSFHTYGVS
jgi:hypothetical protein